MTQEEINNLPKIKGWVARDSSDSVNVFYEKPFRQKYGDFHERGISAYWEGAVLAMLKPDMFPELRWEDKPIEVELTIRPL